MSDVLVRSFVLMTLSLSSLTGALSVSDHEVELKELKESLQDTQPVGALVNTTRLVVKVILTIAQ